MKRLNPLKSRFRAFAQLIRAMVPIYLAAWSFGEAPPPETGFSFLQEGTTHAVRWNAGTGAYDLKWSTDLKFEGAATLLPSMAADGSWRAEINAAKQRGFFSLLPAGAPAVPKDVALLMGRTDWRLTWTPAAEAGGYLIIIHEMGSGGSGPLLPLGSDLVLDVGWAASAVLPELTKGAKYSITLVAKNDAGQSDVSEPVQGTYGPGGPVYGYAAYQYVSPDGQPLYVRAGGALVILKRVGAPISEIPLFIECDESGAFRAPFVSADSYTVETVTQLGIPGPPVTLQVGQEGATIQPVSIATDPHSIFGRIRFADGTRVGMDDPLWGISHRATVQILRKGTTLISEVMADAQGGYAAPPPESGDYPVTIKVSYQNLETSLTINPSEEEQGKPPIRDLKFTDSPPRATRISAWQNGKEVEQIKPGVPVEFHAEADNPKGLPLDHRWHVESLDGKGDKQKKEFPEFSFQADSKDQDVTIRLNLSDLASTSFTTFRTFRIFSPPAGAVGAYSGMVAAWDPASPDALSPLSGATITCRPPDGVPVSSSTNANGYFESNVHPSFYSYGYPAPHYDYLVRVEKPGYVRFLWAFNSSLPNEQTFPLVPTVTSTLTYNGSPTTVTHSNGMSVGIMAGGLQTSAGLPYTGPITVSTATFNPLIRLPLPHGMFINSGLYANQLLDPTHAAWVDIRTDAGAPLILTGVNLAFPTAAILPLSRNYDAYWQNETSALFDPADTATSTAGSSGIILPVTKSGLYFLGEHRAAGELSFEADRSLNYPFEVMVGKSTFPITIKGPSDTNWTFGTLFFPLATPLDLSVLDQRQAPGLLPTDLSTATTWTPPWKKRVVIQRTVTATTDSRLHPVLLSLSSSIPGLKRPDATTVTDLEDENHFLSRSSNPAVLVPDHFSTERQRILLSENLSSTDYYQTIRAPRNFTAWKTLNGFPAEFGAPLPGVPAEDYANAHYYNLADLGFARAQSMRVRMAADGQPDVAFYVTNYANLEDARRGVSAVATVCMDYSLRADLTGGLHRHTRFYVYAGNFDQELGRAADLDRAGFKAVPGLCISCHGGSRYEPTIPAFHGTTGPPDFLPIDRRAIPGSGGDLGSRFLPFDLESYTFHPKWGVEKNELARMNAGVVKTQTTSDGHQTDITKLILGWYGGAPNASPESFDAAFIPPSWSKPGLYGAFKIGCRGCHISRDDAPGLQFSNQASFTSYGLPLCTSLEMPHSQRTWSSFWGTKAARSLGDLSTPDLPAALHDHEGSPGGCPALSR